MSDIFVVEFMAGNTNAIERWNSSDDGQYIVLSMSMQTPLPFSEVVDVPADATQYYSYKRVSVV